MIKKRLLIPGIALLGIVLPGVTLYQDAQRKLAAPMRLDATATLHIRPGDSLSVVVRELAARGWFEHSGYLRFEAWRRRLAGRIHAGEYLVEPGMSAAALLELIIAGKVVQHALTLPEGWTFSRILAALRDNPLISNTLTSSDPGRIMAAIGYPGYAAEGRFFPDTYYFTAGETDLSLLRRAMRRMQMVLQEEWQQRAADLPYRSSYQALILASLVEKEAALAEERAKIAGVFVRRLQKNMKLQTDPTVIYALGDEFDGNLRRADLTRDSPYNTYRYKGLPPTPIAAAGRASIRAAMQPEPGAALYFVATGEGGRHHFSRTLAEHNKAVAEYQLR